MQCVHNSLCYVYVNNNNNNNVIYVCFCFLHSTVMESIYHEVNFLVNFNSKLHFMPTTHVFG